MLNRRHRSWPAFLGVSWAWTLIAIVLNLNQAICAPGLKSFPSFRHPQSDLGAAYTPAATTLKVWAPTAERVEVVLFAAANTAASAVTPMTHDADGIWSATLRGNLEGKYYLYRITLPEVAGHSRTPWLVNDPYARGCSANTGRTLIYDPAKTNPEGWAHDQGVSLKHNTDAVLYEVHVRDFTINRNSGCARRGQYLGMVEAGTRTAEGETTGLDHLKELGITHVHLLPVNDFAGGDERQQADQYTWYDWGYDPVLFQTPEGSYASDPDGTARQKEFKTMVQGFHRQHLGVVLDVVFNHTASVGPKPLSIFDKIYPGYYYRTDAAGAYANSTGCGNEVASERPMVRKFIVDTIKYWMTEYHVDGFRFDLMGILDRDTMLEISREARQINPNVLLYGEGWDMEQVLPPKMMMTQANVAGTGLAAFNDGIRDNIKGDAAHAPAQGFVQGSEPPYGGMERLKLNIKGQSTGKGTQGIAVASPNDTINYASAHDDLCLWDKLQVSTDAPEPTRISMDKLAAGMVLTAQGVPFIHAGDEFLRSKNRVSNTYNDPRVNAIDWSLKSKHKAVFNFYHGLILLRRAHPAFRMSDRAAVDRAVDFAPTTPPNVLAYVIRGNANGDAWKNILVIYNGSGRRHELSVAGDWTIVVDEEHAGIEPRHRTRDKISVAPFSLIVAHTEGPYHFPP